MREENKRFRDLARQKEIAKIRKDAVRFLAEVQKYPQALIGEAMSITRERVRQIIEEVC